ncbi:MAG TPA: class I SAM-dependent methyltransferase [Acidobacteriaceae bacterium]|nr:class I SAM-dependent methyltransferase [Acidobacteriaceae bacterium]
MGLYAKYVLPRIIDLAMRNEETARLRAAWIPLARGEVLEVGIGSGLNLPFYSSDVRRIYGVDPSVELQRIARDRVVASPVKVEFLSQSAEEQLPLADASIDTVVTTWTLCSIANAPKALREMKRVLKAGGHLLFLEHGRAVDPGVADWQERITPLWKNITGGCHLNRKIDDLITAAGFRITELKTFYVRGPRPMTYTYQGAAQTSGPHDAT